MRRLLAFAVMVLMLSGCALPHKMPASKQIRSVILVPAMPEALTFNYIGWIGTNKTANPVDWGQNEVVQATLLPVLQSRYDVRPAPADVSPLINALTDTDIMVGSEAGVEAGLPKLVQPGQADVIIVISGSPGAHLHFDAVRSRIPYLSVRYRISVFDGTTFKPIAYESGLGGEMLYTGSRTWQGEDFGFFSPSDRELMRRIVTTHIGNTMPRTLGKLGL